MKIHEYQARQILEKYNVAIPQGSVASTVDEARRIASEINRKVVVKAQVHAGGRGKGGGIKSADGPEKAATAAKEILGMKLTTHQTGPEGKIVGKVLVVEAIDIERELYVGIVLDRSTSQLVYMVSTEGGVEIETVAAQKPEKILKEYIDPAVGLQSFQIRKLAFGLGLQGEQYKQAVKLLTNLYNAYIGSDASLAEINPLIVATDGRVLALDAKINIDDNALYRHPEIVKMRDLNEEEPLEVEASKYDLNYIKLDGTVGCMVNGAGLAMATMDIIKLAGAEPANFLDVGGGASVDTVENGFKILLSDDNVKAVLINIFGGIVRCDRVAQGVVEAVSKMKIDRPVVVRLEGTNAVEAANILEHSNLDFIVARGFADAAEKVIQVLN